jgi:hypothetical protein
LRAWPRWPARCAAGSWASLAPTDRAPVQANAPQAGKLIRRLVRTHAHADAPHRQIKHGYHVTATEPPPRPTPHQGRGLTREDIA